MKNNDKEKVWTKNQINTIEFLDIKEMNRTTKKAFINDFLNSFNFFLKTNAINETALNNPKETIVLNIILEKIFDAIEHQYKTKYNKTNMRLLISCIKENIGNILVEIEESIHRKLNKILDSPPENLITKKIKERIETELIYQSMEHENYIKKTKELLNKKENEFYNKLAAYEFVRRTNIVSTLGYLNYQKLTIILDSICGHFKLKKENVLESILLKDKNIDISLTFHSDEITKFVTQFAKDYKDTLFYKKILESALINWFITNIKTYIIDRWSTFPKTRSKVINDFELITLWIKKIFISLSGIDMQTCPILKQLLVRKMTSADLEIRKKFSDVDINFLKLQKCLISHRTNDEILYNERIHELLKIVEILKVPTLMKK